MFTGIIEERGKLKTIHRKGLGLQLFIQCRKVLEGTALGDSIAVNGVCLSVTELDTDGFRADVMAATSHKTELSRLKPGSTLHLERAMTPTSRMGGHFVTGHVDGTARILNIRQDGFSKRLTLMCSQQSIPWLIPQGSVALDGVSLTIQKVMGARIEVALIPETLQTTELGKKRPGNLLHFEGDILLKRPQPF